MKSLKKEVSNLNGLSGGFRTGYLNWGLHMSLTICRPSRIVLSPGPVSFFFQFGLHSIIIKVRLKRVSLNQFLSLPEVEAKKFLKKNDISP